MPDFSQPTLGLVRDALIGLVPDDFTTAFEKNQFWEQRLFDSEFPSEFIKIASTYEFHWTKIIPDLKAGTFRVQRVYGSVPMPRKLCDLALSLLAILAVNATKNSALREKLVQALEREGLILSGSAGESAVKVPAELEALPRKEALLSNVKTELEKPRPLVSVLFVDLDNFKAVNDELGHDAGDRCLVRVVELLNDVIYAKGLLYRYGGDEFCVLLKNFSRTEAAATAERIRAAIDTDNPGGSVKVTCSIGVASSETKGLDSAEALLKAADEAMYVTKHTTKNGVTVHPPLESEKQSADTNRRNPGRLVASNSAGSLEETFKSDLENLITRFEMEWESEKNVSWGKNLSGARQILERVCSNLLDLCVRAEKLFPDKAEVRRILRQSENKLRSLATRQPEKATDFRFEAYAFWQEGFETIKFLKAALPAMNPV